MTTILDTKGLNCPLPVLRVKKAIKDVTPGEILQVLATDPGAVGDFQAFCKTSGNEMVDWKEDAGVFTFNIRKTG
jgi:tRNA 2-thiouridine synthesizing protein A